MAAILIGGFKVFQNSWAVDDEDICFCNNEVSEVKCFFFTFSHNHYYHLIIPHTLGFGVIDDLILFYVYIALHIVDISITTFSLPSTLNDFNIILQHRNVIHNLRCPVMC